jgi:hypothetical protein
MRSGSLQTSGSAGSHYREAWMPGAPRTWNKRSAGVLNRQPLTLQGNLPAKIRSKPNDYDKEATPDKSSKQKEVVVKLLIQLAHYAEANCKDDMTTFLSFGFTPAASTKAKTAPVSEMFRRIETGPNSGEMLITLMKFLGAVS